MVRTKQTARRSTRGLAPRRQPPPAPKPFPKGRHVLETLYSAINEDNINLAKYVLACKIYGKENLYNAIENFF